MLDTAHGFRGADAVCVIGIGVGVEGLKLPSLFPGQGVTEIRGRVPLGIVLDGLAVICGQEILPSCIAVNVGFSVFLNDVPVPVILHGVDNTTVLLFGQKLTQGIIGVFKGAIQAVRDLGNTFLGVVLVVDCSAVGEGDALYKLCGRRGLELFGFQMLLGHLALDVVKLADEEAASQLQFVKELSSKAVGLRMARNRSAARGELYHGVVVVRLVIDGLRCSVGKGHYLLVHLTFGTVIILDGVDDNLGGDDLTRQGNIAFGCAKKSSFLVFISILFFRENVNRTNDISLSVVDVLVVCGGGCICSSCLFLCLKPLFRNHLTV